MDINSFLGIAIVGVALSLIVEYLQVKFGMDGSKTKALVIVLSIVVGGFYWFFKDTAFYQAALGVLAAASTVYALFFSQKPSNA